MVDLADSRELVIREVIPDKRGVDNDIAGKVKTVTFIKTAGVRDALTGYA